MVSLNFISLCVRVMIVCVMISLCNRFHEIHRSSVTDHFVRACVRVCVCACVCVSSFLPWCPRLMDMSFKNHRVAIGHSEGNTKIHDPVRCFALGCVVITHPLLRLRVPIKNACPILHSLTIMLY